MDEQAGAAIFDRALAHKTRLAPRYTGGTISIGTRVPPEVQDALKLLADQAGALPTDVIRAAVFEYLENHRHDVMEATFGPSTPAKAAQASDPGESA
jgi:hypothetical protein